MCPTLGRTRHFGLVPHKVLRVGKSFGRCLAAIGLAVSLGLAGCGSTPAETTPLPVITATTSPASDLPANSPTSPPESTSEPTPTPTPTLQPKPAGPNCAKLKCIALTYDDGPFPEETGALIKTLRREQVKVTFFMLGQNVKQYPEVVREIAATGSELANHSWSHASLPGLGNSGIRRELKRTNDAIAEVTGVRPTLMRPPYGANNRRVDRVSRELGLAEIYWDVDTLDWKNRDTDRLIDYVLDNAARDQVVLMHDIHSSTVAAAPSIIEGLKEAGYTLVTVSELYPKLRPGGRYPEFGGRGFAQKSDYLPKRRSKS
jgi:peptidoglycan-N-acetylglucosamine deacetylase